MELCAQHHATDLYGGANIANLRAAEAYQKKSIADYELAIQTAFKKWPMHWPPKVRLPTSFWLNSSLPQQRPKRFV